jgi:hypothetical protein
MRAKELMIVILGGHLRQNEFEVKEQIDQRMRDNCRISSEETASEMDISNGNERFLRPNRNLFISNEPGKIDNSGTKFT